MLRDKRAFFAEENERKLRVEKAADLRYGELPQLQQRYQALEEKLKGLGSLVSIHSQYSHSRFRSCSCSHCCVHTY